LRGHTALVHRDQGAFVRAGVRLEVRWDFDLGLDHAGVFAIEVVEVLVVGAAGWGLGGFAEIAGVGERFAGIVLRLSECRGGQEEREKKKKKKRTGTGTGTGTGRGRIGAEGAAELGVSAQAV
jgi:hypothetical protein